MGIMAEVGPTKKTVLEKTIAGLDTVAQFTRAFIGGVGSEAGEVAKLPLGRPALAFILITMSSQAITNNVNLSAPAGAISVLAAEAVISISQTIHNRR